jgi:hypothetical protein
MRKQTDQGTSTSDSASTPKKTYDVVSPPEKGLGPGSAGQSGDTQGLSDVAEAGPESVLELVEEGQYFEAEVISGVENAPDPESCDSHTQQVIVEERRQSKEPGKKQSRDKTI